MDYLWTPWRYQYVTSAGKPDRCVLCHAAESADDRETLVVSRGKSSYVILNRFPYTSGHVMIVPYRHVSSLQDLDDSTLAEMFRLAKTTERHLLDLYRPDGLNLGMNLGKSAGAGIAGHLHLHVLPRWTGDTNFMTVVGETRVMPEALEVTWERLRAAYDGERG
jgi:ATP adenylyltransferase